VFKATLQQQGPRAASASPWSGALPAAPCRLGDGSNIARQLDSADNDG